MHARTQQVASKRQRVLGGYGLKQRYALFCPTGATPVGSAELDFIGIDRDGNVSVRFARPVSYVELSCHASLFRPGAFEVSATRLPEIVTGRGSVTANGNSLSARFLNCEDIQFCGILCSGLVARIFDLSDGTEATALAAIEWLAPDRATSIFRQRNFPERRFKDRVG